MFRRSYSQTPIVHDLDHTADPALVELWRRRGSKGAVAEEKSAVIVSLSVEETEVRAGYYRNRFIPFTRRRRIRRYSQLRRFADCKWPDPD